MAVLDRSRSLSDGQQIMKPGHCSKKQLSSARGLLPFCAVFLFSFDSVDRADDDAFYWTKAEGHNRGEDIPLLARIIAIADSFEIMHSGRPYKQTMSRDEIVAEYKKCSRTQFDPKLSEIFLSILEEL